VDWRNNRPASNTYGRRGICNNDIKGNGRLAPPTLLVSEAQEKRQKSEKFDERFLRIVVIESRAYIIFLATGAFRERANQGWVG
jgi:hypothetical protein